MSGSLKDLERVFIERGVSFVDERHRFGVTMRSPIGEETSTKKSFVQFEKTKPKIDVMSDR